MIGSQAAIAEPRATVPSPTARARVAGQVVGDTDDRATDRRGRPERPDRRLGGGQAEPVDELGLLVGPQEEVDRRVAAPQPGPVRLAHRAAGEHHAHPRVGRLEPGQLAHPADDLLLGALADRAGVDDDEVGGLERVGLLAAGGQQPPGHLLRIAAVHLAAERPDVEARQGPGLGQVLGEAVVGGRSPAGAARSVRVGGTISSIGSARLRVDRSVMAVRASLHRARRRGCRRPPRAGPTGPRAPRRTCPCRRGSRCRRSARDRGPSRPRRPRRPSPCRTSGSRPRARRGRRPRARGRPRSAPAPR